MDFTKDNNPTALYEVGIKAGESLPHYVKEATLLQEEDVVSLNDCAFADPVKRLHPIHTKAATYMSAVYLAGNGMRDSKEFEVVKSAAALFEIEKDIDAALDLLPQTEKSAFDYNNVENQYALTFNIEEDDSWKSYPIGNSVEVTKSATDVVRDWLDGHIPTDWFYHAAKNIVKKANELKLHRNEIPERVWNLGEERLVDFDTAEVGVNERARLGIDTQDYTVALKQASEGKITVEEATDIWMGLDAVNNVSHIRTSSPHECFYSGVKLAHVEALSENNVFISDIMVPAKDVTKLLENDSKHIKRAFRKETADKIISLVSTLTGGNTKSAAEVTNGISTLEKTQQKELLNLLLKVA
jgi:hypothetical protein